MENYALEVKDVKIRYRCLKKISIRKSIFSMKKSEIEVFEAVRGISFSVRQGEIVGIIGRNGSGKSTMLRAIAGVFSPDEGSIDLHGNRVSLLAIGVGFQKKLTGRENIYLSGMLLGYDEAYVDKHIKQIIRFSGLGDFIDKPVKTYSSGMYSKLAFSITAFLETDIMLIDEVLSVGDASFKEKSFEKMRELISDENRTVLIVSHSMGAIKGLCSKVLWLEQGELMMEGTPDEVIPAYHSFMKVKRTGLQAEQQMRPLTPEEIERKKRKKKKKKKKKKRKMKAMRAEAMRAEAMKSGEAGPEEKNEGDQDGQALM